MKIKIIDLLNKIADGKELPKKFMCKGHLYYRQKTKGVCYRCDELNEIFEECFVFEDLNDTIEIIEEPKKIEKWGEGALEEMEKCTDYTLEDLQKYIRILAETQNELIDEINNLKGND